MQTETVSCELCSGDDHRVVLKVQDKRHGYPGVFNLVECTQCSLRFLNPRPTQGAMVDAYPANYVAHRRDETPTPWKIPFAWAWDRYQRLFLGRFYPVFYFREQFHAFQKQGRAPRILDVGCGSGSKLLYLKRAGWETYGLDFSPEAVQMALDNGVHEAHSGEGGVLPYEDNFFDAAMSWHSLEHHFHPKDSLKEMARVLVPGGHGAVAVPTGNNLGFRVFKENWGPLEPPRHLYHFTQKTLAQLVEGAGLEIDSFYYDYPYYGLFLDQELFESIENLAASKGIRFRFPRFRGDTIAARIPVLPFSQILGRACRGMNLVVHFKKPV